MNLSSKNILLNTMLSFRFRSVLENQPEWHYWVWTQLQRFQGQVWYLILSTPGLKVIKLEFILKLKINHNNRMLVDTCPQAANHCTLFWDWDCAQFYNLKAWSLPSYLLCCFMNQKKRDEILRNYWNFRKTTRNNKQETQIIKQFFIVAFKPLTRACLLWIKQTALQMTDGWMGRVDSVLDLLSFKRRR